MALAGPKVESTEPQKAQSHVVKPTAPIHEPEAMPAPQASEPRFGPGIFRDMHRGGY